MTIRNFVKTAALASVCAMMLAAAPARAADDGSDLPAGPFAKEQLRMRRESAAYEKKLGRQQKESARKSAAFGKKLGKMEKDSAHESTTYARNSIKWKRPRHGKAPTMP